MAVIQFTYKVTLNIADEEIDKLTEFLTFVKNMKGDAKLVKTTTEKAAEDS
jgi:hypothetical protein